MDCWLPETWCGLFKTPCCLEETLSVACPPSPGGPFLSRTLVRLAGAGRASWGSCWAQGAVPCTGGHLTAGPSLGALSWTGSGGLWILASAVLLFSFVCASQVVPLTQGKKWRINLICYGVCPDLMCNTQLGKPLAVEDFFRVKNILRRLKSCVQFI